MSHTSSSRDVQGEGWHWRFWLPLAVTLTAGTLVPGRGRGGETLRLESKLAANPE
jgi:hypothetical protein